MVKRKFRPFTLFLWILLLGFIVFGPIYFIRYRPTEDIEEHNNKENDWKGVITLWDYPRLDNTNGTRYGWMTSKIKKFERENPGVYIDLKPMELKSGPIELETAIKTKTYPDIAPIATDYCIISKNVLEPVDQYLSMGERDNYKTQALSAVRFNGKTWGFPWMMTTNTMILNADLFHQRNVELPKDGNWTYDQFVEALKKLTYDEDGDGLMDVFGFYSYINLGEYPTWGIILSDGGEIFDKENRNYRFNDDKAASGLKKLIDLKLVHGVTPENFGENSEKQAWEKFYKDRKIAVYPGGIETINLLMNLKNRGEGFEFMVANYPIGNKGVPVALSKNVSAYGIFKQQDQQKLEMCVKFIKFITNDEYQRELNRLGFFPIKKSVGGIYDDPIMHRIEENLAYTESVPDHPSWMIIDDILQSQIRQVLLGNKTINAGLEDAEKKIKNYSTAISE